MAGSALPSIAPLRNAKGCALTRGGTTQSAFSFSCPLHDLDFFRRQAVETIHQPVYLPLQRAHVGFGVVPFRRKAAVNEPYEWLLLASANAFNRNFGKGPLIKL